MSLETWKKEFYNSKPFKKMTTEEAILHSLKKWEGALEKNTKRHNLKYDWAVVFSKRSEKAIHFDGSTCALCSKFYDGEDDKCKKQGKKCPVVAVTGETCNRAYSKSQFDPSPMIRLLKKVLAGHKKR